MHHIVRMHTSVTTAHTSYTHGKNQRDRSVWAGGHLPLAELRPQAVTPTRRSATMEAVLSAVAAVVELLMAWLPGWPHDSPVLVFAPPSLAPGPVTTTMLRCAIIVFDSC